MKAKIDLACVIDDDPIFTYTTKKMMDSIQFSENYLFFKNGDEAIEYFKAAVKSKEKIPEVIFLDLNMPVMDGWEFLDQFTSFPVKNEVVIYIVSSSINPFDLEKAKTYEKVSNYIIKPINVSDLKKILNTLTTSS